MARANTISHVDLPTGPMESANVGRVPSGVPGNPLYSHGWHSGHEWHSGSQGKPSSLTIVSMPSFPRKRESTSVRKASEFSIFTEMASFRGARTRLDLENDGSLVYAIWDTDDPPDTDRESMKQEVYDLIEEAGTENWDGEGALALAPETAAVAQKLIDHFPSYVAQPDVAATPHGEVDFDWIVSQDVMLTVSVCPSGEIAFAGLFRDARLNGREPWTGALPQFVSCCFERLLRESQSQ